MIQADANADDSSEKFNVPSEREAMFRKAIAHPDNVELASLTFWESCRIDLGRAVASMTNTWRDPVKEFENVREAVRKGMSAALAEVSREYHSQGDRPDEAKSDAGRLNQLHSIRDTTIDDCARVADEMNHADETCYDIAREIRALKDKNPREEK